jgi:hypothetical protein
VSQIRLGEFRQGLAMRPADSLQIMIRSDEPFLGEDQDRVLAAYAQAWAFTHFLLNQYPEQYVGYIKHLSGKKPLVADTPEVRLTEFETFFGSDWHKLDREFLDYVQLLK